MKTLALFLFVSIALLAPAAKAAERSVTARVTVYWRGEGTGRASWNGTRLGQGHCAVDPKKIPYGSRVIVGRDELLAVDTGPSVVSRRAARSCGRTAAERNAVVIDQFFETKAQADAWEQSHPHFMSVRVVSPDRDKEKTGKALAGANPPPSDSPPRQLLFPFGGNPIASAASTFLAEATGE